MQQRDESEALDVDYRTVQARSLRDDARHFVSDRPFIKEPRSQLGGGARDTAHPPEPGLIVDDSNVCKDMFNSIFEIF